MLDLPDFIRASFSPKTYSKGSVIVHEGQICRYLYYIDRGLIKQTSCKGLRTFNLNFFPENTFVTLLDSFTVQRPTRFQLAALEDCELLLLSYEKFEAVCNENHVAETFFRKVIQMSAVNMVNRIHDILENDAAQRYANFLSLYGPVAQRISLGNIADYLGITQVSLSRIRSQK